MSVSEIAYEILGLSTREAAARLGTFGPNALPAAHRRTAIALLGATLREPMLLLLLAATAIYVVFGDLAEALALATSVLAIVAITVLQERRTERALDALRELASPTARVLRDGVWRVIDARELVPGDAIQIAEGDRIPADALLRDGSPITVDESLLTGESVPVVRQPDRAVHALGRPGEESASVFAGTLAGSGSATAEVIETGPRTEVGRIGAALGAIELARAPVHREVARVVRRIATVALALSAALGAIYVAIGHSWLAAALAAITLAMSLLPEELPVVLAIFLALGAWRIARHRVLARRAAAIETLGAMTVLCVDKTGTLTRNEMQVARLVGLDAELSVDGAATALPESVHEVVEFGALACPRQAVDPMDRALAGLAARALARTEHVHPRWQWLREYPLRPGLLAVTHAWRGDETPTAVVATKGAPEAIVDLCHLDEGTAAHWHARAEALARDGLRVLGVARATSAEPLPEADPHEFAFELVGLVGLADPLRDDTAATIAACRGAGVRIVMITGDHPATARAIGRAAGLATDELLTGPELETLPESALLSAVARTEVIARAAPAHKLRIVQALRARGEIVGMTGDGVNDAPALQAADIGIAMGRGTDVARDAAGLVLVDDALAAIVPAIRIGRTIYDNLRKVSSYLLAVHFPIAALALLPPLLGWPLLLGPVHIVLLELVMDPTCSIVFELEPPAADVMTRPPRRRGEHLFELGRVALALVFGVGALAGPLAVAFIAQALGAQAPVVRATAFVALIAADLALVVATRGRGPLHAGNPATIWMVAAVALVTTATLAVPWLRGLFGFGVPGALSLAAAVLAGALPVLALGLAVHRPRAR